MANEEVRSIFDILKEYAAEKTDLDYMKDEVDKGEQSRQISEYINSDIPSAEKRLIKLTEELKQHPAIAIATYKKGAVESYEFVKYELEKLEKKRRNNEPLTKEDLENEKQLNLDLRDYTVHINLMDEVLHSMNYVEPEEEYDSQDPDDESDDYNPITKRYQ